MMMYERSLRDILTCLMYVELVCARFQLLLFWWHDVVHMNLSSLMAFRGGNPEEHISVHRGTAHDLSM